jgi:hypothetical protein
LPAATLDLLQTPPQSDLREYTRLAHDKIRGQALESQEQHA